MSAVKEFFSSLSDLQKDIFVSVATDLQATSPAEKLERLKTFHGQLKTEIDQINKRRQSLGGILNNINTLLKYLEEYISKHGETLEVVMFQSNLQKVSSDIKAEIAALKPDKKLEKKFDVARRMESLAQRNKLSGHLFTDILADAEPDSKSSKSRRANVSALKDLSAKDLAAIDDLEDE